MTFRNRLVPALVLVAFAAGLTACGQEAAAPIDLARPVVVAPVEVTDLADNIEATGQLMAREQAVIASETQGRITEITVDEGDRVEEGAMLALIDPERRELELANARAQLTDAGAALAEAKRDLDRILVLHNKGIASEQALDQARTAKARAQSRYASVRAQRGVADRALQDATIRSPFEGLVARRQVSRGEFVNVGQPLFELVALDPIEVEFSLAERDSARVAVGQKVDITVSPYPGEVFEGTVSVVSPTIDAKTRTLRVKARVPNTEGRLRPGLFARAELGVALRQGIVMVPEEAVLQRAAGQLVYVARGDLAHRVIVTTGAHRDGLVEIVEGLAPGDEIVVRGQAALGDGTPISRRNADGSPETSSLDVASDGAGGSTAALR